MNTPQKNPSEIAREVLTTLAKRRLLPTPDNYQTLYQEIAGITLPDTFPERSLKTLIASLPRNTTEQTRLLRQMDQGIKDHNWDALKSSLNDTFSRLEQPASDWAGLIRELTTLLETRSIGYTLAQKKDSLDHVLGASSNPELLFQRLHSLNKTWSQAPKANETPPPENITETPTESVVATNAGHTTAASTTAPPTSSKAPPALQLAWRDLLAQVLDNALPPLLSGVPPLAEEASLIASEIRNKAATEKQLDATQARLRKLLHQINFAAEDQNELRSGLHKLLKLLVENIDELVIDDQWLQGQVSIISQLVSQPLDLRRMDDVERRLRDVISKQSTLKSHLNDAKDRFKEMLAVFVDRLGSITQDTGSYHDAIAKCAERISNASDIQQLSDVVEEVMRETRSMQLSAMRNHDDLSAMQSKAKAAENEINRLQSQLAEASDMVRTDALTGALNRKGMDEVLEKEVARATRHGTNLSIALLDIDNFKKLNDTLGHDAGDKALIHLVKVIRDTIRPQDSLARYGGEEFVVLLPDTTLDSGVTAMTRVQRELTKKFFLNRNEKVLITFSCGVSELMENEEPKAALKRADQAMYLAKRAGKNRVLAA